MTPTGRWTAIALFASLAANLFLAGMLFGDRFRGRHMQPPPVAGESPAASGEAAVRGLVQRMIRALPAELQPGFETRLAGHRGAIVRAQQDVRQARVQLRDQASAERFDRPAVEAAYETLRQRNAAVQKAIHDALIDASADLPAEARRAMLAAVAEGGGPRGRPPGGPGGGPPGPPGTRP